MSEVYNYLKGDSSSNFPTSVDNFLFIEDTKIRTKDLRESHENNIENHMSIAMNMLNINERFTPITSCLINNLIARTYNFQDYILNTLPLKRSLCVSSEEPMTYADEHIWIKLE